jgi:hypothetical protein
VAVIGAPHFSAAVGYVVPKRKGDGFTNRLARVQLAHFNAAMRFEKRNVQLGLPAIIFSTFVGTSVFASLNNEHIPEWAKIVVGLI